MKRFAVACALVACLLNLSCQSAVKTGESTALTGIDLVAMTEDMATQIAADADVNAAIASRGALKVVVQPVVNQLRAEIIPSGQATAFTGRVRVLLSKHAPDRFTWIMNRDAFYALRSRELDINPGPSPDAVNPDYALTATFSSLGDENSRRREQFYVCAFELTNLQDRTLLWAGSYEVKKTAVKGFLD
ncbi:MAG: hypothetical protein H7144_08035 [Burkholderiales bacterium]|nr:hypothetical protein [Phycisphaerae bacterium]